jgi:deoxyribodipyrimidine photo-lyase
MSKVIWWLRRDLRLSDNPTLHLAIQQGEVIPIFILDPLLLSSTPVRRQAFLFDGLHRLDEDLRARGSRLISRRGMSVEVLAALMAESGAEAIYAEEDFTPYARQRDEQVAVRLPLHLVQGQTVHHPGEVLKWDRQPYTVFTPYSKAWKGALPARLSLLPAPDRMQTSLQLPTEALPGFVLQTSFPSGEAEAQRRLKEFLAGQVYEYGELRNRPGSQGTSQLSPYLRFGMLSMRQAVAGALRAMEGAPDNRAEQSAETWLNELIWREFYISILYNYPRVLKESFRADLREIKWQNNPSDSDAWKQGFTGYPFVDAGMRQLAQLGWMHNRLRMITASFLVKHLLVDWRLGEAWFMENLLDGDLAANNGGWQWTAGTGTDAAPYFRVFNPVLQSQKFDPQGGYIRRWLPELERVPDKFIHTPWEMPGEIQKQTGCRIGYEYPAPIVDHSMARQRVLDVYGRASRLGS